ncbi:MAG: molybdate ABC transporter substrate-binding protein [Parvibaculum sp.]|nr:molybdate ABC transporter substrate-binding protein [Parvibaculum sp.]
MADRSVRQQAGGKFMLHQCDVRGATRRRFLSGLAGIAIAAAIGFGAGPARADAPLVFAAASLKNALDDVIASYAATGGGKITASYAASSVLARQIEAGAKAEVFISADADWMDYLGQRGLVDAKSRENLLGNRLVLIAPKTSTATLAIAPGFPLLQALGDGRLAIADPDSVPAGKYGRSSLTSLGVWSSVVDHIAIAENVRVALAYVARGETPLGIVYETDALQEPKVRIVGYFPEDSHLPIVYPAALTNGATPEAARFFKFLTSDKAQAAFRKAGFSIIATGTRP